MYTNRIPIRKLAYQVSTRTVEVTDKQNSQVALEHMSRPRQIWRGFRVISIVTANGELKLLHSLWKYLYSLRRCYRL